ncbi:MAG: helix-turn-helix transcriptional regulator [Kordiimonadaceae bacterium]|nr:helix-turn-helix transcriptional regulator [Kordiimonadaceae bacterium]
MQIKSAIDIGRLIRLSRQQKGWSQAHLAGELGTSQRWVSEIENGKSRAELGRVLKCLRVLDVKLDAMQPKKERQPEKKSLLQTMISQLDKSHLEPKEVSLIKAMTQSAKFTNAEIQAYFIRPDRPVNMGRIVEVAKGMYPEIPAATNEELQKFIGKLRDGNEG